TGDLIGRGDGAMVTIDAIVAAAGVGRQTIYRWWPSRTAVVLDALVESTLRATPFPQTDDVRRDFRDHLRRVARLFNSPTGTLIRALVAEAIADPAVAGELHERFWEPRRDLARAALRRGVADGQVRAGLDEEAALDALYGPLWARLLVGHRAITAATADAVID